MIDPDVLWGIFARLLGVVYVIAFVSLRSEIVEWAGARGLNPVREKLARVREDLGRWRAVVRYPTLLWLGDSDRALRWLPGGGAMRHVRRVRRGVGADARVRVGRLPELRRRVPACCVGVDVTKPASSPWSFRRSSRSRRWPCRARLRPS